MLTNKWSGYGTSVAVATSELDGLASAGWFLSGLIDNSSNLNILVDLDLVLSAAVTAGAGSPKVDLYLLPAPNAANSPTPPGTSAGAIPSSYRIGQISANASASFTRGAKRGVQIPPGKYRIGGQNNLGVALPASSNTLTAYPYNETAV